jgi:hypothetical protein
MVAPANPVGRASSKKSLPSGGPATASARRAARHLGCLVEQRDSVVWAIVEERDQAAGSQGPSDEVAVLRLATGDLGDLEATLGLVLPVKVESEVPGNPGQDAGELHGLTPYRERLRVAERLTQAAKLPMDRYKQLVGSDLRVLAGIAKDCPAHSLQGLEAQ